jgi:hypothetical protein
MAAANGIAPTVDWVLGELMRRNKIPPTPELLRETALLGYRGRIRQCLGLPGDEAAENQVAPSPPALRVKAAELHAHAHALVRWNRQRARLQEVLKGNVVDLAQESRRE